MEVVSTSPATPPGVRVRTGRFDGLRLADKPGHTQRVKEAVRQSNIEARRGVVPPAPGVGSHSLGGVDGCPASDQLTVDDRTSLPMLELHGPKPVTNPLVEIGKHARCFREPEVSLPTREILSEWFAQLREASTGIAPEGVRKNV